MKRLLLLLLILGFTACSSQNPKESKTTKQEVKKKLRTVYEKEVGNLDVDNSVPEKLTFIWDLPDGADEIAKIQILRKYSTDISYKKIRVKGLKADSTKITIDEYGLITANYKIKLIAKDGRRSKGMEIEAYTKHPTVVSDFFDGKKLSVYLPKGYEESDKRYPVMYMWDGQKLFSEGYGETWEIDETIGKLSENSYIEDMIVVGVFNSGSNRGVEYFPFQGGLYDGYGDETAEYLAEKLVPYIDGKYKTIANRENRGIMGSSMGGLMSMYTITTYSDVFSMAGIISPWFPDQLLEYIQKMPKRDVKLWLDAGTDEASSNFGNYALNTRRLVETLKEKGYRYEDDFVYYEVKDGVHQELEWSKRVHNPFMRFKGTKEAKSFDIDLVDEQFVGNDKDRRFLNVVVKDDIGGFYSAYDQANYRSLDGKIDIDSKGKYEFLDENGGEVEVEYKGIKKTIMLRPKK